MAICQYVLYVYLVSISQSFINCIRPNLVRMKSNNFTEEQIYLLYRKTRNQEKFLIVKVDKLRA
jgi:hypothetical protein